MKSDRHTIWLEWGFRLLIVMLLGLWFLIPNASAPASLFSLTDRQGGYDD